MNENVKDGLREKDGSRRDFVNVREKGTYNYEDLIVWKKGMDLVERVYSNTKNFPKDERYGLTDQVRRAVTSIVLNIAEGQGKGTKKDFRKFLIISRGSAYEVNTILQICMRLGYIGEENYKSFRADIVEITRMISGLIKSLEDGDE